MSTRSGIGIDLNGVARRYGERLALAPTSLSVAGGEVVALVGPNGAGKSTLLRVLAGVIAPTEGAACVGGWNVAERPLDARRHLGYLPQKLGVPLATVVSDLASLVARIRGVDTGEGLAALTRHGLADRWSAKLSELSGGQRQRVMLALATLGRVDALVLDEPAISLDADGGDDVREAIRAARRSGAAVLFASHHLSDVAQLADRVAVMVAGGVVACGSIEELARAAGVPWESRLMEPPIERIYRTLVRGAVPDARALKLVQDGAA